MKRDLMDLVEELERKILGIESLLSFYAIGMEVLNTKEDSYEVYGILTLHDWLMSIRKVDIDNLYSMIDSMEESEGD